MVTSLATFDELSLFRHQHQAEGANLKRTFRLSVMFQSITLLANTHRKNFIGTVN